MNGVNGYQAYQSSYDMANKVAYHNQRSKASGQAEQKKANEGAGDVYETSETGKTQQSKQPVKLSEQAKALLEKLKDKFGNTDFIVASHSSDKEAKQLLAGGSRDFSVLIDPELLEEMAADDEVCAKYEGVIKDSQTQLKEMAGKLGDEAENVKQLGISINNEGKVSFFAELDSLSRKQRERIEAGKEKKAEAKKAEAKKAEAKKAEAKAAENKEQHKTIRISADSAEELLEKIKNYRYEDQVKEEERGTFFDVKL